MAVVGSRQRTKGNGYAKHDMAGFARAYSELAQGILTESHIDLFSETGRAMLSESALDTLENFYMENAIDEDNMTPEEIQEAREMMREHFLNDVEAVKEYAPVGQFNPVMGMVFPLHKNLLMNSIWDKGIINKAVAVQPKFTISMEHRMLVDVDGSEIDLYKNQKGIKAAMDKVAPFVPVELTLPESGATDILDAMGATPKDNLSIQTYISEFQTADNVWHKTMIEAKPGYGDFDRMAIQAVTAIDTSTGSNVTVNDVITFTMKNNTVTVSGMTGAIKAVKLMAKKDTSNGLVNTPSVKWSTSTEMVEIAEGTPINTTISPEEVKDIQALYNVDQLTKLMAIIKDVMSNYKDDSIKEKLDQSYDMLEAPDKMHASFDFKPPTGYAADFVSWRKATFLDVLDTKVTELLNVLNDPNMTVNIVGRPDIIRKVVPTEYSYRSPGAIGPVELDFERTVVTSNKRVYNFVSSQKIVDDELILILNPRNSDRIVYRIYDYQLYVSNDIRNAGNHTLPAVHAFERWTFKQYQPIQGRIQIKNPDGGFIEA